MSQLQLDYTPEERLQVHEFGIEANKNEKIPIPAPQEGVKLIQAQYLLDEATRLVLFGDSKKGTKAGEHAALAIGIRTPDGLPRWAVRNALVPEGTEVVYIEKSVRAQPEDPPKAPRGPDMSHGGNDDNDGRKPVYIPAAGAG